MIAYDAGQWGLGFILQLKGSMLPKALPFALPNALLAVVCHHFFNDMGDPDASGFRDEDGSSRLLGMGNVSVMWSSYTFVLGFLIVFRNNQAYQRFWQGAVTLYELSGDWFDALSCLFAFSNPAEDKFDEVNQFQQLLLKLGSMLFCAALQTIAEVQDGHLEVIELDGVDAEALEYLAHAHCRVEVIMQWIQHLIVESASDDVLRVPAPILSRVFQELSNGMVRFHSMSCIRSVPFPFPYAQMITGMLIVHWIVTPLLASQVVQSAWWAGILCFCIICSFWSLIFIALEIDQPFGRDANDLPIEEMMKDWNSKLMMLLDPVMQCRPQYVHRSKRTLNSVKVDSDFKRITGLEEDVEDNLVVRVEIEKSIAAMETSSTSKAAAEKARRRLRLTKLSEAGQRGRCPSSYSEAGSMCSQNSPQSMASESEGVPAQRLGLQISEQVSRTSSARSSTNTNQSAQAKKLSTRRNSENSLQRELGGRSGAVHMTGSDGFAKAQPRTADGSVEAHPRRTDEEDGLHEEGGLAKAQPRRADGSSKAHPDRTNENEFCTAGDEFADSQASAVHAGADSRYRYPPTVREASVRCFTRGTDVASEASQEEHVKC